MRITGGVWRGRTLRAPKAEATRPTQDRVREALFNLLQPVIAGARFLDLYAGSGAVGLEALIDPKAPDADLIKYMAGDAAKIERLLEYPDNIRTPVVRNGKQATVGYCPEVWKTWE